MNNNKVKIAPSLLSANFANLENDIEQCEVGGADILHLDVMDGHFVPNLTFGPIILKDIRKCTSLPISTHLMVEYPDSLIPEFAQLGSDYISFHVEAVPHIHRSISLIKSFGKKVGVALNPATPIEYAYSTAEFVDFILLMSVNPGFGGQEFIDNFYRRANLLKEFILKENLDVLIEVDGGVKIENAQQIVQAGADILVSGSGIFNGNIAENIQKMRANI